MEDQVGSSNSAETGNTSGSYSRSTASIESDDIDESYQRNDDEFSSNSSSASSGDDTSVDEVTENDDLTEDRTIPRLQTDSSEGLSVKEPMEKLVEIATTEWDKALMQGKASTGKASDFFSMKPHQRMSPSKDGTASGAPLHQLKTPQSINSEASKEKSTKLSIDVTSSPSEDDKDQIQHVPPPPPPHQPSSPSKELPPEKSNRQSLSDSYSIGKGSVVVRVQQSENDSINDAHSTSVVSASATHVAPPVEPDLSAGILPDVLMNMRQKIESLGMFDSDMMRLTAGMQNNDDDDDPLTVESRESLKRSSQQSISAAVLVSLAHKRYERRRLAAMEIEKVVRSLVALHHQQQASKTGKAPQKNELERVYAILLLLSDDFCRSTNEDARKGGTVALAACAIGLKRADDNNPTVMECRDLILASVVHACQDHSQRVRYYATESLFNVVKVIPSMAVQHFFILFEVLRSLYADVDPDVRSGAELLDKKLKEVIVGAMNAGFFTADACVPVFGRFVYMRNKATKRLTLTWLQELNEKLIGSPILEFLHLFLGGVIEMVADPSVAIRQSALAFLQSVLPKLVNVNSDATDILEGQVKVDFDKILQALVTTLEHPNPFVRKVAMYWMSRIVKAHMNFDDQDEDIEVQQEYQNNRITKPTLKGIESTTKLSAASVSVRNSVPHILPGVLICVGDTFSSTSTSTTKDSFLPEQTTRLLAEQTNACLQDAVRRGGSAFVEHLDGFIVALREEMASPGGLGSRNSSAIERSPFRSDVVTDGTGIESAGWFYSSRDKTEINTESMVMSRLCALHWVIVLYESVVPDPLKADYAREFVTSIIHQLADDPPESIVYKSLEVLARITIPVVGEEQTRLIPANVLGGTGRQFPSGGISTVLEEVQEFPMTDSSVAYAMSILDADRRRLKSRDRQVFSALIQLYAMNGQLVANLSNVLTYMCKLQPPEFIMVSFSIELDRFIRHKMASAGKDGAPSSSDLRFLSAFVQHLNHVVLNADETRKLREVLKDCIAAKKDTEADHQRARMFHILLHSFSHNIVATLSLCLWAGAYRTASLFLITIDPLDISLIFLLEIDRLVELLERPLFRHLHVRMLERDQKPTDEGSGVMLFQLLKSLLMILPQSTCYRVLRDRLVSVSRFRQSTNTVSVWTHIYDSKRLKNLSDETKNYVARITAVRNLHCLAFWENVRQESLEMPKRVREVHGSKDTARLEWLGYSSTEEAMMAEYREGLRQSHKFSIEDISHGYNDLDKARTNVPQMNVLLSNHDDNIPIKEAKVEEDEDDEWKNLWSHE